MSTNTILVCSDLDRTIIPNGAQRESKAARPLLRALARFPQVTVAYVSGRDKRLLTDAIYEYDLPWPDFAIGDVGTSIYSAGADRWLPWSDWTDKIAASWNGYSAEDLRDLLAHRSDLRVQAPEKQNRFKLSYYADPALDRQTLFDVVETIFQPLGITTNLVWSVDETRDEGLLDILPGNANKLHAIRHLMTVLGFNESNTLFAGDSGNDLPVLISGIRSVLVANATEQVRTEALRLTDPALRDRLYFASGQYLSMNGNYSAGLLEGLVHFFPDIRGQLVRECGIPYIDSGLP